MLVSLTERYQHKIKTAEELRAILGPYPHAQGVIMCHGVFDVVHPGHVRHLLYAKSKADILIASLTADRHISKGAYRPHVSQDLRAMNLAAFEMVDYVLIDEHEKPLDNIRLLQPDYFAKGFEYGKQSHPDTAMERAMVEGYGGELIFTPGDIVYSSSALIRAELPDLRYANLQVMMERNSLDCDLLHKTIDAMLGYQVTVVGDTIVDSYTYCSMIGGQTKTPTLSLAFDRRKDFVGGAGIVAKHMRAAGAQVKFCTVFGQDEFTDFVTEDLHSAGVTMHVVLDETRPTIQKNAVVVGGYRLLKIDKIDNSSISDDTLHALCDGMHTETQAVICSDFRHGIFNKRTIPKLIEAIPPQAYRVADSQVASRWGNITDFKDFDLITPNEREARFALGDQDSGIRPLASALYDQARCKLLILKLGERGVLACRASEHNALDSYFVLDSFADQVVDPVGAGDALLAYSTLAMLACQQDAVATILGTLAASCACECEGNVPITPEHLHHKIDTIEQELR